jgi:hypothetical protein
MIPSYTGSEGFFRLSLVQSIHDFYCMHVGLFYLFFSIFCLFLSLVLVDIKVQFLCLSELAASFFPLLS